MLALNTLLAWYAEGGEGITRVERVIHIDETSGVFTVCLLQERTDRAKTLAIAKRLDTPRRSRASLEAALSNGLVGITAEDPLAYLRVPLEDLRGQCDPGTFANLVATRDRRWAVVRALVAEGGVRLFNSRSRGPIIEQVAREEQLRRSRTLYTWLRYYFQGGMVADALADRRRGNGGFRQPKADTGAKLGRPRTNGAILAQFGPGRNLTPEQRRFGVWAIEEHYLTLAARSIPSAYIEAMTEQSRARYAAKTGVTIPLGYINELELERIWGRYRLTLDPAKIVKRRHGDHEQNTEHRPRTQDARAWAKGPMDLLYADSFVPKVEFVHPSNSLHVIGTASVYLLFDLSSELIVGLSMRLGKPIWEGWMEALANVFEDKVEFCRRYGFQITHDDWPSSGCVPARVGTDRGPENLGTNSDSIPGLDIALLTLPKWRPDLKGQLENRFQLLRTGLDLELPGRRRSRRRRPGDPDPERTAAITPREYFIELLRWVIDYNTTHVFAVDRRTPLMKQARTAPHPAAFFRDAVRFHTGTLRREDPVIVRRHLLVRGRARITREGIRYKGLYYTSDRAVRENWSQRRAVPGWKGDVRVDRRNTEVIYLDLGRAGLEAVKFSDKNDQQFKSFDFDEVEQDQQAFQEQRGEALGRQSDRAIVRRTELRRITAGATRRRDEATKNQPHRARTNDKGVHRGATSADIDREQAEHFAKGVATGSRPTLTPPPASQNHRRAAPPPPAARPARGADIRLFEEAARRKQEREAQLRSSQQHQGANDDTSR